MKMFLCIGDYTKGIMPCVNAKIEIKNHKGSSWNDREDNENGYFTSLLIYCECQNRYIFDFVIRCKHYAGFTISEFC